jgi:hypothetical protein
MIYIDHLSQSMDGNQIRQEFVSKTQQLPSKTFVFINRNIILFLS